jgi:hypothetical protein
MDAHADGRDNPLMARYTFPAYNKVAYNAFIVVWDLQWQVLDCQYLKPGSDLQAAMAAAVDRLADDGWQAGGTAEYGFVFIRRETERRLLTLTPRDPYDTTSQSFSPFRSAR